MTDTVKYLLDETRIPRFWYNIVADLPAPPPAALHPVTRQPLGPADLEPLFPMELILQEVSAERQIEIPAPVREITASGGRRRCSAPGGWRRRSIPRRKSTISTKASAPPAATS